MNPRMGSLTKSILPALLSVVLLAGLSLEHPNRRPPAEVEVYHTQVREANQALPAEFGTWISTNIPLPREVVALLSPNVIFSRSYVNGIDDTTCSVLLVQSRDARDMIGHFPPVCYPGQGWTLRSAKPRFWNIDGLQLSAMDYEFHNRSFNGDRSLTITGFFILPTGHFSTSMDDVRALSARFPDRYFGAAQIQVILYGTPSMQVREQVVTAMLRHYLPLLQTIRRQPTP